MSDDDIKRDDDDQAAVAEMEAAMAAEQQAAEEQERVESAELDDFSEDANRRNTAVTESTDGSDEEGSEADDPDVSLNVVLDIPVTLSMEIGRTKISIRNLLQLNQGSVVELDRLAGEPMDVMVNGTLIAHGEVVVVNERFGIRLTDVVSPTERVRKLR